MEKFVSKNIQPLLLVVTAFAIIALIIVIGKYMLNFPGPLSAEQDVWGQFGDYLGGTLNPILSFLSLLALLFTIILQSLELRLTREEMERARIAQEESKTALVDQANTLRQQLEEAKRKANTETFLSAVDRMQKEEVRKSRGTIFRLSIDEKKPFQEWTTPEKKEAEIACQSFDVIGMMVRDGMVPPETLLKEWCGTIQKTWRGTTDLVNFRREKDGENFWGAYQWLYEESQKYS